MRKTISLTILGLTLLAVASNSHNHMPLLVVLGFLAGIVLYIVAVSFLYAVAIAAASPLIVFGAICLYRRRRQGKPQPWWLKSLCRRITRRLPLLARITATGKAAKNAWRQSTSSDPAAGEGATDPAATAGNTAA